MITAFSSFARAGVIALGVLTGLAGSAQSAPLPIAKPQAPAAGSAVPVVPVVEGEFRGGTNPVWRQRRGGGEWRGGGRQWRGDREWRDDRRHWRGERRHWRGDREWRRDRYWRRHARRDWDDRWRYRRYRDRYDSGIYLSLGVPIYGGYDPYYVAPRRVYRAPVAGNGHVRWCYSRYRSYRAWDNTFQPYNGPRRQCYSPYN
jgi:hypothetical protein